MKALRICFVGDSLTAGTYDDGFLGWPGRVCRAERARGHDPTAYNLGIRADTSALVAARWRRECEARLPDAFEGRIVFSFGVNDAAMLPDGTVRVPIEDSVANAGAMLGEATAWKPVLWIGPLPIPDERQPFSPGGGIEYSFDNARTAEYDAAYRDLAARMDVPYLDLFAALTADERWERVQREEGDGVHPPARGYAEIAARVERWPAWRAWWDG